MKKDIIVLCGFSASGKDSLLNELAEDERFYKIISHTTRPIRSTEVNNKDYFFVNTKEFKSMDDKNNFIEVRAYSTLVDNKPDIWYYGVSKDKVSKKKINIVVLDILGLRGFKEYFGERVLSFFIYADVETRKQRCIERGDFNESEFNRRLADDEKCFTEQVINTEVDYIVESSIIEVDLEEILDIIEAENI